MLSKLFFYFIFIWFILSLLFHFFISFIFIYFQVINIVSAKLCGPQGGGVGSSSFLLDPLLECLLSLIPKSENELIIFQKSVEKPCLDFGTKLVSLGLQADPNDSGIQTTGM